MRYNKFIIFTSLHGLFYQFTNHMKTFQLHLSLRLKIFYLN